MSRSIMFNDDLNGTVSQKIKHISRLIDDIVSEYYKEKSITVAQADVLTRVYNEERLSMNSLCEDLNMSKSNISPVCKKLELAGYLRKTRDFYDQRVVYLELTDEGKEIVGGINERMKKDGLSVTSLIGYENLVNLNAALDELETALEKTVNNL